MGKQPDPWRSLAGEIAALKRLVKEIAGRSPFFGTGMKPDGQGAIQSTNFDGSLGDRSAGTKGWALGPDSAALGDLILRPGSIGNDALTSPVDGKVGNISATGFSLAAGSFVELAGQNIVIPAGFTQALVTAGASVFSYNPNTTGGSNGAGGDAVYCYVACGAQVSHANPVGVSGSGGYATSFSAAGFEFTGLTPGSSLRLSVYGSSAYQAIASHVDNYANAYASVTWLR